MKSPLRVTTWVVPLTYALAAIAAGTLFPRIETHFFHELASPASVFATIEIYSSAASGMLALSGVVFSLAFVMIQFSATAYSPRLVLWIARDPFMWHAVGVFTATFLYAVSALEWVDRDGLGTVPLLSSLVVIALLFASVTMFIGLIQRITRLQINRMLTFTGDQGRAAIDAIFPPLETPAAAIMPGELDGLTVTQTVVHLERPEVVQALDEKTLVRLASASGAVIEMIAAVGDTVVKLTPLMYIYGARQPIDEKKLIGTIEMDEERGFKQDPKYAIRILVDIALKALAAGSDPTTAVQALDQIEDLLLRIGLRRLELGKFYDAAGQLRLVVPYATWEDYLRLALDEILYCGAHSVQVMRRMKALIHDLISRLPQERHAALLYWDSRLQSIIARSFLEPEEKLEASVEDRQGLGVPRRPWDKL